MFCVCDFRVACFYVCAAFGFASVPYAPMPVLCPNTPKERIPLQVSVYQQNKCNILLPDGTTKSIVDLNVGDEIVDGFGKKAIVREKIERKCDDDFAYRFNAAISASMDG